MYKFILAFLLFAVSTTLAAARDQKPKVRGGFALGAWQVPFDEAKLELALCNTDRLCATVRSPAKKNCGPDKSAVGKNIIDDAVFLDVDGPPRWTGKIKIYCTLQPNGVWFSNATPREWDFLLKEVPGGLEVSVQGLSQTWKRAKLDRATN